MKINLKIKKTVITQLSYQTPLEFFDKFHQQTYNTLLIGNDTQEISEFSFIGIKPHTIITFNEQFRLKQENIEYNLQSKFWETLNNTLSNTDFNEFPFPANLCGGIGYISYEAVHQVEKIEKKTISNYQMPILQWIFYNQYFVFDHKEKKLYEIKFDYETPSNLESTEQLEESFKVMNLIAECEKEEYIAKVERIRDMIFEGDVYEVNLSQQFRGTFSGDPFIFFKKLFELNDAQFSAYLNYGNLKIACNSPELFLKGEKIKIETRPIKGTINRGKNRIEDQKKRKILLESEKDQAELYMIIDLLRNDLGKVCKYGSIQVQEAKRLEEYQNVYHLVGIIKGILREQNSYWDLLKATFPGGSITGCPKVSSLNIIEHLETFSRNIYTGTIFMMNREYFISNIVIRTAVFSDDKFFLNSGGAITIDSSPEAEYNEINHKLTSMMEILKI
ncbi:MAG: anthranilate synthase component I family protein [Candidatus Cloacimonetes bacterium]|nr:anthranilate synthase component I family protein [Candidatus Cloacimonadota bacterium]